MDDEKIKELILAVIEQHSGGLKLITLMSELVYQVHASGEQIYNPMHFGEYIFKSINGIDGVKVLEYVWHGRPKYFIYIA